MQNTNSQNVYLTENFKLYFCSINSVSDNMQVWKTNEVGYDVNTNNNPIWYWSEANMISLMAKIN